MVPQAAPSSPELVLIESAPGSQAWIAAHTRETPGLSRAVPAWAKGQIVDRVVDS